MKTQMITGLLILPFVVALHSYATDHGYRNLSVADARRRAALAAIGTLLLAALITLASAIARAESLEEAISRSREQATQAEEARWRRVVAGTYWARACGVFGTGALKDPRYFLFKLYPGRFSSAEILSPRYQEAARAGEETARLHGCDYFVQHADEARAMRDGVDCAVFGECRR